METIVKFETADFPGLSMSESLGIGGQMLGIDDLDEEGQGLLAFAFAAGADPETFNQDEILYVESDSDSILQRIYAPAVWAQEDENGIKSLVLRIGSNPMPVTVKGGKLISGNLSGEIDIETKENAKGEAYLAISVIWDAGSDTLFISGLRLDGEKHPTKTKNDCVKLKRELSKAIADGAALADYLMVVGQGGGKTLPMHELGAQTEHLVEAINVLELDDNDNPGETRTTYTLTLASGDSVWAKGNVARVLNDPMQRWFNLLVNREKVTVQTTGLPKKCAQIWHLKSEVTLKIGKVEELGTNKWTVACQLIERAPALAAGAEVTQAALAPADADKIQF